MIDTEVTYGGKSFKITLPDGWSFRTDRGIGRLYVHVTNPGCTKEYTFKLVLKEGELYLEHFNKSSSIFVNGAQMALGETTVLEEIWPSNRGVDIYTPEFRPSWIANPADFL